MNPIRSIVAALAALALAAAPAAATTVNSFVAPLALSLGGCNATSASGCRTSLGLGTAALAATGASGHALPYLDVANTFANGQALGTPASGVATNLTGLPLTSGVTGILPAANGGTGNAGGTLTAYTPTVTCTSGTITSYSSTGAWEQIGKMLYVWTNTTITTIGSCANILLISTPGAVLANRYTPMVGYGPTTFTTYTAAVQGGTSSIAVTKYDGTLGATSGTQIITGGWFEAQ